MVHIQEETFHTALTIGHLSQNIFPELFDCSHQICNIFKRQNIQYNTYWYVIRTNVIFGSCITLYQSNAMHVIAALKRSCGKGMFSVARACVSFCLCKEKSSWLTVPMNDHRGPVHLDFPLGPFQSSLFGTPLNLCKLVHLGKRSVDLRVYFQFRIPFVIFVIFKAILAIYTLVWLIIFLDPAIMGSPTSFAGQSIYVFLTSWAYILLVIYLWTSLLHILFMSYKHMRNGDLRSIKDALGHYRPQENTEVSSEGEVNDLETGCVQENVELLSHTNDQDDVRLENCSVPDHSSSVMCKSTTSWHHKIVWILHDMTSGVVCMVCKTRFQKVPISDPGSSHSSIIKSYKDDRWWCFLPFYLVCWR